MKSLKYIAAAALLAITITACDSNRSNATLGGTKDTTAVLGSSGTSGPADTAKFDTVNKGNVDPSGKANPDTSSEKTPQ